MGYQCQQNRLYFSYQKDPRYIPGHVTNSLLYEAQMIHLNLPSATVAIARPGTRRWAKIAVCSMTAGTTIPNCPRPYERRIIDILRIAGLVSKGVLT